MAASRNENAKFAHVKHTSRYRLVQHKTAQITHRHHPPFSSPLHIHIITPFSHAASSPSPPLHLKNLTRRASQHWAGAALWSRSRNALCVKYRPYIYIPPALGHPCTHPAVTRATTTLLYGQDPHIICALKRCRCERPIINPSSAVNWPFLEASAEPGRHRRRSSFTWFQPLYQPSR